MATLAELNTIISDPALKDKVKIALLIKAEEIRTESDQTANHANRLKYAKKVLQDPDGNADDMLRALIGQNSAAALSAITGASDATILTAVGSGVNIFADGQ